MFRAVFISPPLISVTPVVHQLLFVTRCVVGAL